LKLVMPSLPRTSGRSYPAETTEDETWSVPPYAYGSDRIGRLAERFVLVFGMPGLLVGQTVVIGAWVALNTLDSGLRSDPYPFIFLNLLFSALAAYAAPFILLAQTWQADRDRARADLDARRREQMALDRARVLQRDAAQTDRINELLAQTQRLIEPESDQTDMIASPASGTIAVAQASHAFTREIHAHVVERQAGAQHEPDGGAT
jgi:uncharacterized membrane protein